MFKPGDLVSAKYIKIGCNLFYVCKQVGDRVITYWQGEFRPNLYRYDDDEENFTLITSIFREENV